MGNWTRGFSRLLFFGFHLLGEWRETSAYRPMARLLRGDPEELEEILGDAITETVDRVMAAVFDGDPEPMFDVILDPDANEFVRAGICDALALVTVHRQGDRTLIERFLRDAFVNLRPQAENEVWHGWQSAVARLGMREMRSLVRKAFDRGYISPDWMDFADFDHNLELYEVLVERCGMAGVPELELFGNTIEELSNWYAFSDDDLRKEAEWRTRTDEEHWRDPGPEPRINIYRDVGRNDPCPCGSGKKFKKCCLLLR